VGVKTIKHPNKKEVLKKYLILDTAVATTDATSAFCPCVELLEEACGSPPEDALDDEALI
jgi:hypothetical protein